MTRPLDLKWLERVSIAGIVLFYLILDMYTFSSKGFHRKGMTYLQMLGSAAFLAALSGVFAVYGVQVHNRLVHFERQQKIHNERNRANFEQMDTARSFDLGTADDIPVAEEGKAKTSWLQSRRGKRNKNSPAAKIRRIIYVVEGFAVVVVAGQVREFTGWRETSGCHSAGLTVCVCVCARARVVRRCTWPSRTARARTKSSSAPTASTATKPRPASASCTGSRYANHSIALDHWPRSRLTGP